MEINQAKLNWEILYGGRDFTVEVADQEAQTIQSQTVKVVKIPLREMQRFANAYGKVDEEAVAYLGSGAAAVELAGKLTDESKLALVEEGRSINSKTFGAWFKIQKDTTETLTGQKMADVVNQALEKSGSGGK